MRTGIGIINEVIQKVDIANEEGGAYLELTQKQICDRLCIPLSRIDYLTELLQLVGKERMSEVNDVPVRIFGTMGIGEGDSVSDDMDVVAVGDFLEDKWLLLSSEDEANIVDLDTLIEDLGLQDAEPVMLY